MAENLPAKKDDVASFIEANKKGFQDALPKTINLQTFSRICLTALRKNTDLMKASKSSLAAALMQSAALGLVPDGFLGQAYLIPYNGEIQLQLGYRGLIALARRSGEILSITARAVHENDYFIYLDGLEEKLEYRPADGDRGEFKLAYCIARFKDGGHHLEVMYKSEIDKVRAVSKAKKADSPWNSWYDEMAKKTVIKRASKLWPVSLEAQEAINNDTVVELGEMDLDSSVATQTDDLREKLAGMKNVSPDNVGAPVTEKEPNPETPEQKRTRATKAEMEARRKAQESAPEEQSGQSTAPLCAGPCGKPIVGKVHPYGNDKWCTSCASAASKPAQKEAAKEPGKLISCANPKCQLPLIAANGEALNGYEIINNAKYCVSCAAILKGGGQ